MLRRRVLVAVAGLMVVSFVLSQYLQSSDLGFLQVVSNVCWFAFWTLAFFFIADRLVTLVSFLAVLPAKRRERRVLRDLNS